MEGVVAMAGGRRMRRANAADGARAKTVGVKVTADEHARLVEKAAVQGVTVQGLMVGAALSDAIESVTERRQVAVELMKVQRWIGGTADNMNQIARKANTVHEIPSDFRKAIAEARAAWERCDRVLEEFIELNRRAGA